MSTKLTCAEDLSDSVVVAQFTLRSAHKISGTDTCMRILLDLHWVG